MKRRSFLQGIVASFSVPLVWLAPTPPKIATKPFSSMSEIKARRFDIIDRAQIKAKEAIQREEDLNIFKAIHATLRSIK